MRARFVPIRVGALVLLAGSSILVGCGATGLAWVDEPETKTAWGNRDTRVVSDSRSSARAELEAIPATADEESAVENHQRLNHTITLGEVDASESGAPVGPPSAGPSVSVTINNYGQSGYAPYGGYYAYGVLGSRNSGFARGGVTAASRSAASGVQAGQNWPSVADHGSSFPYRSAPASPWSPAGPR